MNLHVGFGLDFLVVIAWEWELRGYLALLARFYFLFLVKISFIPQIFTGRQLDAAKLPRLGS